MIRVRIYASGEHIRSVEVSGHGGGARGTDVVCSAVSAVAQTALAGLLHYGGEGVRWRLEDGFLSMHMGEPVGGEEHSPLSVIMNTLAIGLREIAREHPDRVSIELEQDPRVPDEA
jgi:uncharacterized protein YsxB (DUF464 family)